jgi:hypothetical protein
LNSALNKDSGMQMPIEKKWNKMKLERKDIPAIQKTITIAGR